jgi:hypothetical protein
MGTRHLVAVQMNGEYKLAQYGQWDGYPEGQGVHVLDFLKNGDIEAFKRNLAKTYQPTDEEQAKLWLEVGVDIVETKGMVPYSKSDEFAKKFPSLHRNTGAGILQLVADSEEEKIPVDLAIEFAADSLFCEWAYVIDFDIDALEVYKGFNKEPVPADSRFAQFAPDDHPALEDKYYQVALAHSWKLSSLPSQEEFLQAFAEPEENIVSEDEATPAAPNDGEGEADKPVWAS